MVEAPGIDRSCTESSRFGLDGVQDRQMTGEREEADQASNMVEAPGIEPGSENGSLAHLRT